MGNVLVVRGSEDIKNRVIYSDSELPTKQFYKIVIKLPLPACPLAQHGMQVKHGSEIQCSIGLDSVFLEGRCRHL